MMLMSALPADASTCTPYEREVRDLAISAQKFQRTERFREYGFSAKGQRAWLTALQELSDQPEAKDFARKHQFVVMDIYSVADEYRTEGSLDDFFKEKEVQIRKMASCS